MFLLCRSHFFYLSTERTTSQFSVFRSATIDLTYNSSWVCSYSRALSIFSRITFCFFFSSTDNQAHQGGPADVCAVQR